LARPLPAGRGRPQAAPPAQADPDQGPIRASSEPGPAPEAAALLTHELDIVEAQTALRAAVGAPKEEADGGEIAQLHLRPVSGEISQADADGLQLVLPAGAGPVAGPLVGLLDASAIHPDVDGA